jgi:polyphosphate:AMP phosphotransferase
MLLRRARLAPEESDMFEAAEIGASVTRVDYEAALPELRTQLINAQFDFAKADFPVLLMVAGDDRVGCNEVLNLLHEWMDARYLHTHVFGPMTEEEASQPRFWRFWRALPGRGQLGIFAGSWVTELISWRLREQIDDATFDRQCDHLSRLQQLLTADGALVLKFWIHLPKHELDRRIEKADKRKGRRSWRIEKSDRRLHEHFDAALPWMRRFLRLTDTGASPWTIVEGSDDRHRNLLVARTLLEQLGKQLAARAAAPAPAPAKPAPRAKAAARKPETSILDAVDLTSTLAAEEYQDRLSELQGKLHKRVDRARKHGITSVLVFEGWDAAGKGGVIRRITSALDAGEYQLVPIAAPSDEELAHHYLWRFWRRLPRPGHMVIFDRSWYGRVLVERVEGLAPEADWRRAYEEINEFEANLAERGFALAKFWLHIDRDEQLRRFEARLKTPYKKYKITDEDHRNRERWDDYVSAVGDMVSHTSTDVAPWRLVPANDKRFARIRVLEVVCDELARRLA